MQAPPLSLNLTPHGKLHHKAKAYEVTENVYCAPEIMCWAAWNVCWSPKNVPSTWKGVLST